jgi:excisionase family DNA binding protein
MLRRPPTPDIDVLDTHDAAALLRVSTKTLLRQAAAGEIPARRVGRQWRFSRSALIAYVSRAAVTCDDKTNGGAVS